MELEGGGHYEDGEIIHIERSMVPEETLKALKANDILEFKVVNPDENGLIAVSYNMPKKTEMSPEREGSDEMMGDFKEYMSARRGEGEQGGMSEGTGGGY